MFGVKIMANTLTYKVLEKHLLDGTLAPSEPIAIRIDQTLTQDATGTTAFLLFESMGMHRVKTDLSVSYVDHNTTQLGPENHNDHLYLQSIAGKIGAFHSRPGNGICHQLHLERFAKPGATLLGSDSHTPTAGGVGALAIGAGGMDVAVAMGDGPFHLTCPKVIGVKLLGQLNDWVSSKDVILKLLSILTTKGNVGCVVEYFGDGVKTLSVPQRATITNMGAELGVTTSIFPSDENTFKFLKAQERADHYQDIGAEYDRVIEIDLSQVEPMAACPSSPDNIKSISKIAGTKIAQVVVGSCTNSSFTDLMTVAHVLKEKTIDSAVEFAVAPGSKQVLTMLAKNGALADIIASGARILESACGPCIGQGFSPANGVVSLRTFNRNFSGRSGTKKDQTFLVSPETAVASALMGEITDPRTLRNIMGLKYPRVELPSKFLVDDNMVLPPLSPEKARKAEVLRAPTIVVPESPQPLPEKITGKVLLKCEDKITTDHIMPAGVFLKLRSNVPEYAKVVFNSFNEEGKPTFAQQALELKAKGIAAVVVAGQSYGQGSSREHAALCPMYLGVRALIAKSIERIHKANLINFAIVPIEFAETTDYDKISAGTEIEIDNLLDAIQNKDAVTIINKTENLEFTAKLNLSQRDRQILLSTGLLNYTLTRTEKS
jgi:aconitate hydratase